MCKKIMFPLFLLTIITGRISAYAEDPAKAEWKPDISGGITAETMYVWRGQKLVDNVVIEPEAAVTAYGFTLSVWGNYDAEALKRFTELDYTLDYSISIADIRKSMNAGEGPVFARIIDRLGIRAGYTFYTFPNLDGDNFDSGEYYIGLTYDIPLQPWATFYDDIDSGNGTYWEAGLGHDFEIGKTTADLGITIGYNGGQWGYDAGFTNLLFTGSISMPVAAHFSVAPDINYSVSLDEAQYDNEFFAGVRVGCQI